MVSYSVNVVSGIDSSVKSVCDNFCQQIQWNGGIPSDEERGKLNEDAVDRLMADYPLKNVMVVLTEHKADFKECTHVELDIAGRIKFHVYVFKSGEFTLHGDGGTMNWCFGGNFNRDGEKHVTFSDRV